MSVYNLDGKEVLHVTNGESVEWSTDCGDLFTNAGASTPYVGGSRADIYFKAVNQTKTGTLSAGDTDHTVNITGVIPFQPNYGFTWKLEKRGVITNIKRDGSRNGRILGSGETVKDKKLVFRRRRLSEYEEFEAFYDWHYPHRQFKYEDLHNNEIHLYQFAEPVEAMAESTPINSWECELAWIG